MNKDDAVNMCLFSLSKFRMYMANLEGFDLSGLELKFLQSSYSHLEHIKTNLDGILQGKEITLEEKHGQNKKRSYKR